MATFSVTDIGTFKRCRRRWDYESKARRNLTGIGSGPEPLELGGLVHRALADWIVDYFSDDGSVRLDAKEQGYLAGLFLKHASNRQREISEAFEARTGYSIPAEFLESLHNVIVLGSAMMQNYQLYHKKPLPSHMRFASPEQEILVAIPGTEHQCPTCWTNYNTIAPVVEEDGIVESPETVVYDFGTFIVYSGRNRCSECDDRGYVYHYLSATLDGLLQDNNDWFWILEHKTYENRPRLAELSVNDQFTGYAWVVRQLKIGQVAGVAYDGMWKREEPPKYLRKERRAGTLDDLFIRKPLPKEDAELDEWGRNLALVVNEMANEPAIYPNIPWQGCSDCSFQEVCVMQLKGEDPSRLIQMKYTQREVIRGGKAVS